MSPKVKPTPAGAPRVCGIADALGVVGDRWALLVVREIGLGVHRFNDIQANTGAPRDSLATRLRQLQDSGLVSRHRYNDHPPRDEYVLTEAGKALGPALAALRSWGEMYARVPDGPENDPASFRPRGPASPQR